MCVCMYYLNYLCMCVDVCVYVYIYIERERRATQATRERRRQPTRRQRGNKPDKIILSLSLLQLPLQTFNLNNVKRQEHKEAAGIVKCATSQAKY